MICLEYIELRECRVDGFRVSGLRGRIVESQMAKWKMKPETRNARPWDDVGSKGFGSTSKRICFG